MREEQREGVTEREGGRARERDTPTGGQCPKAVPLKHRHLACLPLSYNYIMSGHKHIATYMHLVVCEVVCVSGNKHMWHIEHAHSTLGTYITRAHVIVHCKEAARIQGT